jgi:hypothetical protein
MIKLRVLGLLLIAALAACNKDPAAPDVTGQVAVASPAAAQSPPQDLFTFAAGTQVVSDGTAGDIYGANYGPYNLIDESSVTEWMVEVAAPASVILELAERTSLTRLAFDTGGMNIDAKSAKSVRVEVSDSSATSGYKQVLEAELKMAENGQEFVLPSEAVGRWVKITAQGSFGSEYLAMVAVHGYGKQLTSVPGCPT